MAELKFKELRFEKIKDQLKVHYQKIYFFLIPLDEIQNISDFSVFDNTIKFEITKERAEKKFQRLINKYLPNLINKVTGNPTTLVHSNSGIPLFGSLSFGIVDKGSNAIEIKPSTGCNIDCIFCSVDEGKSSKKTREFLVEKRYIIGELKNLLEYKKVECDIYINPHGEPLLYPKIVELVTDLKKLIFVKKVTIITNGTLLNTKIALDLIKAGLDNLNISINALETETAKKLSGTPTYSLDNILQVISKIKDKIKITLTPVLMNGVNEKEIEKLVEFSAKNKLDILIQNFQINKKGRKPAKELQMDKFYLLLKNLKKKYNIQLTKKEDLIKTKELKKPFLKGDIITPEKMIEGRFKNEKIAIYKNRTITVNTNKNIGKIKITSDKHNIYYGILL